MIVVRIGEQRQRLAILGSTHMPDPCIECGASTHDAGVHHPAGIPDVLHLSEQTQPVRAVHPAEQFGAGPAVAVLAGHRAAKRDNEIRGFLDERS